ncbi:hypothetical protein DM01DRAFT_1291266 [Hesseltinella vesiculosa]|uniref:Reverse transcriptase zinc-binding domain-containing protein n=1 Tax=Hesseltinella vesiculosa TaxID=101127 RepID=A0A1X2GB68_9FUNG|nr:hypothetical protein DM01DRAFT_1291266 [Hesseltinella vesiculosa]
MFPDLPDCAFVPRPPGPPVPPTLSWLGASLWACFFPLFPAPLRQPLQSRTIRRLLTPRYALPSHAPGVEWSAAKWESFWRTSLPHSSRTVLFRFLTGKLTSRSLLFRIVPTLVSSPKCSICRYHDESSVHLLFACPFKMRVWRLAWQRHFATPFDSIQNVVSSFTSWSWPPLRPGTPSLSAPLVLGTILAAIWSAHWRHVYDDIPFSVSNVLISVNKSIQLLRDESRLLYPATL